MYINNGTVVNINYQLIPAGYTKPTVTTFDTAGKPEYEKELTISMVTAGNADRTVTMANIITEIETQVDSLVQTDFDDTSNDVTVFTDWYDITSNKVRGNDNAFLTDEAAAYVVSVRIYVETAPA